MTLDNLACHYNEKLQFQQRYAYYRLYSWKYQFGPDSALQ